MPYPEYYNQHYPFSKGYKILEFALFYGEEEQTIAEHVSRFTIQCCEAKSSGFWKLRLFGGSFDWDNVLLVHETTAKFNSNMV